MAVTDTSEKGLETLIVESLVAKSGYTLGHNEDFDRHHARVLSQFTTFIAVTQPDAVTDRFDVRHLAPADTVPADEINNDAELTDDIEVEDAMADDESDLIEEAST